jgi:hypothetical protein
MGSAEIQNSLKSIPRLYQESEKWQSLKIDPVTSNDHVERVLRYKIIHEPSRTTLLAVGRDRGLMPRAEGQTSSVYVGRAQWDTSEGTSKVSECIIELGISTKTLCPGGRQTAQF